VRRLVVLGGLGFFGGAAVARLRADGAVPLTAARRPGADLQLDAEDPRSLRRALQPGDVVIDTIGPFQTRSMALLDAALEVGFDLVDIADSRAYVAQVYARQAQIAARGRRVLTACSSISAVSAALVRLSGLDDPVRVTGFLAPATRFTSNPGSARSLLGSVGQPVTILDGGQWATRTGWRATRRFHMPPPIGSVTGHLFETADAVCLPHIWPGLRRVDFFVDSRVPGLNAAFTLAARWPLFHRLLTRFYKPGLTLVRLLGSAVGCLAFEIEARDGRLARYALIAAERGYLTPIVPAVIAARALAEDRFEPTGLVPADQHVDPEGLLAYLQSLGVRLVPMAHG
jgi:hypothetical protein